ncbi:hypothetical protein [Nocardia rhizosphaerae]|uniref:DUF3592 domain-containing protein n=1 Tax=Nocardia rhizosphaerae TaxID=1691571 RepID=A0ABV8LA30_9NOCA
MFDLAVPMLAGLAAVTVAGFVCGLAYHHILVPVNEALRSHGGPGYTARRPALAVAHTCALAHDPMACPCPPRRQRTIVEYQGVDWSRRRHPVPGRYPLGAELSVRVRYAGNRPYPLTRITVLRSAIRGAAAGVGFGLVFIVLLIAVLVSQS